MPFDLDWRHYIDWLVLIGSHDVYEALDKANTLYEKQHGHPIDPESIRIFWEDYWKRTF